MRRGRELLERAFALALLFSALPAHANPVDPAVAAGAASFQSSGRTLTVTNAPGTILNWQSFSIGAGELTRFQQQSSLSAILNRVTGGNPSSILGTLSSNGRVFLINPNGLVFGAGAVIDTAGFVASTLNMTDRDFLAGRLKFEGGGAGVLRNEGTIQAGGDIFLVGPRIENAGLIRSEAGSVLLAAGRSVTITSPDAQGVQFALQAPTDSALNIGAIDAKNAAGMFAGTLRHSGDIRVASASADGTGRVILSAQKEAIVEGGATISADNSVGRGGSVQILGEHVGILDQATLGARGAAGGGEILVGGDYQGANAAVRNATTTYVGADARLNASDGGKVIVWADDAARVHGSITAPRGFVETSGRRSLDLNGIRVNAASGTWLIDPINIEVVPGGVFTPNQIGTDLIGAQLDVGTSVVVSTSGVGPDAGTITVNAPINKLVANPASLSLLATSDLLINQSISLPGTGDLILTSSTGGVSNSGGVPISAGGNLTVNAVTGVSLVNVAAGTGGNGRLSITNSGATSDIGLARSVQATNTGLAPNDYAIDISSGRDFFYGASNSASSTQFRTFTSGGIRVRAGRNIDLNNSCCGGGFDTTTSAGDLVFTATSGHIIRSTGPGQDLSAGGSIVLTAGTNIGSVAIGQPLGAMAATGVGGDVTLTAGTTGTGAIALGGSPVTANDAIVFTAPGRVDLGNAALTATNGSLSLTSTAADVVQTACCTSLVAGGDLTVNAVTGVSLVNLAAGTGGNGRLSITNSGATSDVGLALSVQATNAGLAVNDYAIDISSGRDFFYGASNSSSSNRFRTFTSGGIRVRAGRNIDLNTSCCGGGPDTTTAAGDLVVTAGIGGVGNIVNTSGNAQNLTGDSVYLSAVTSFNTGNTITAPNTISLELTGADLSVGLLTAQNVILSAPNNAILDANGGANNVAATTLAATARTGIDLDTNVASLAATNTGTGAVSIREADGATVTGLATAAGAVTLTTGSGALANTGAMTLPGGATITGAFANTGTVAVTGGIADFGTAAFDMNGGNVSVSGGATLSKSGGGLTWNDGTLAGAGAYTLPTVTVAGAGTRVLNGPTIAASNVTLAGGSLTVQSGTLNLSGTTTVGAGTTLTAQGGTLNAGTTDVAGTLQTGAGALTVTTATIQPGGTLTGAGTLTGNVVNNGTVAPGASPGTLVINGDYTQGAGGILAVELGGTTQGVNYDLLQVTGTANLGGTLTVSLFGPFVPAGGNTFDVVTYASRTGDFAGFIAPAPPALTGTANATFYQLSAAAVPPPPPPPPAPLATAPTEPALAVVNAIPANEVSRLEEEQRARMAAAQFVTGGVPVGVEIDCE